MRRTLATTAESLDLPAYAVKRLLNHKMTSDVTAGYIMRDIERLRKPMQHRIAYVFVPLDLIPLICLTKSEQAVNDIQVGTINTG